MKKLLCLVIGLAFIVGTAATTMAGELDIYGQYWGVVSVVDNGASFTGEPFNEDVDGEDWQAYQRIRQYFEYMASDNLKAVVGYEFDTLWGDGGSGDLGADDTGVLELKRAMLDWTFGPGINLNVGVQGAGVPGGATGNPVLVGDMSGIVANVPFNDMMSLTTGWIRLSEDGGIGDNPAVGGDADAFMAALPISAQGLNISPYAIYAYLGEAFLDNTKFHNGATGLGTILGDDEIVGAGTGLTPEDNANAFWIGVPFTLSMMDPLIFKGQIIYGSLTGMDVVEAGADDDALERSGFYADFSAEFKMDWGTPTFYGLYSSGEDDDFEDGSETFPTLFSDGGANGGPFTTAFGFNGCCSNLSFGHDYSFAQYVPHGIWKLGLGVQGFSFLPNLSHDIGVAYIMGTHDEDAGDALALSRAAGNYIPTATRDVELTEEDSAWELRWYSQYDINENLYLVLDLGYASMDMDSGVWGSDYFDDDIIYASSAIAYSF